MIRLVVLVVVFALGYGAATMLGELTELKTNIENILGR